MIKPFKNIKLSNQTKDIKISNVVKDVLCYNFFTWFSSTESYRVPTYWYNKHIGEIFISRNQKM